MAGIEVSRQGIDSKVGDALLQLRQALDKSYSINKFFVNNPVSVAGVDPLVEVYGYTVDEAYLLRLVFEGIAEIKDNSSTLEENARKLTGLE